MLSVPWRRSVLWLLFALSACVGGHRTSRGYVALCTADAGAWSDPPNTIAVPIDSLISTRDRAAVPRYPVKLREDGINGTVTISVLVDTLGRVDSRSVRVTKSTRSEFTAAVCAVVPAMRFARKDGRPLEQPMRVVVPFEFQVRSFPMFGPPNKPLLQSPQTLVEGAHVLRHARQP
jgi:TonB family protein